MKDCYRIRYKEGGETKVVKRRYGKDKEKAFEKIKLEQEKLVNKHFEARLKYFFPKICFL